MRSSTRDAYAQRVLRVQQHIEANLGRSFAAEELANVAHLSLHHFHRVFRGVTGETVLGYARRLRLERAARQLRSSQRAVVDVALDAGYSAHEAFTRAFAQLFGVSPTEYRTRVVPPTPRSFCEPHVTLSGVEVRDEVDRTVVAMRHVGPYERVSATWERLAAWLLTPGNAPREPDEPLPRMYGLVPDDPQITAEHLLRYDACFELAPGTRPAELAEGPVALTAVPAGRYAVATHRGPYDRLADTYVGLIGGWFPTTDHALAAEPVVERYLNSPHDTAPDDLVTEIWVRIEERGWLA